MGSLRPCQIVPGYHISRHNDKPDNPLPEFEDFEIPEVNFENMARSLTDIPRTKKRIHILLKGDWEDHAQLLGQVIATRINYYDGRMIFDAS